MIKQLKPQLSRILFVFGLLTLSFVLSPLGAAAQIDTSQTGLCSTEAGSSSMKSFPDCAAEIQAFASSSSGGVAYGTWEGFKIAAYQSGEVYWAINDGQYRWQLYTGELPQPAQEAPPPQPAPIESNPQSDQDQDGILDGTDQCPTQAETYNKFADGDGCPDSVEQLVELAGQDIDRYWRQVFANAGVPYDSLNGLIGYRGKTQTECGPARPRNAFYCFNNRSIYYDIDFVEEQMLTFGDFAPVVIIAHEWGHFIQHQLEIWHLFVIQAELQADCFAGSYAQNANQQGHLEQGDLEEGAGSLYNAGDYALWFEPNAHGTPEQRRTEFIRGFEIGLQACF